METAIRLLGREVPMEAVRAHPYPHIISTSIRS